MTMPTDWRRAVATYHAATGKAGPRALVVAILARAALDLADGDPAAARFFLSKDYRHYLELIELPADYLPAGVTAVELVELVEGQASRRARQCRKMSQNITL
jgi:hypothetical protein